MPRQGRDSTPAQWERGRRAAADAAPSPALCSLRAPPKIVSIVQTDDGTKTLFRICSYQPKRSKKLTCKNFSFGDSQKTSTLLDRDCLVRSCN